MGNDGGTIARGQDLKAVYVQSLPNQEELNAFQKSRISACSLSSLPLNSNGEKTPVVGDYQGKLYLKEKIIELLLEKRATKSKRLPHINSLADVVDLKISWEKGVVVCPVSGTTAESKATFAYLRPCGTLLALKALTDLCQPPEIDYEKTDVKDASCPQCGTPFRFNYDVVIINPDPEQADFNNRNYEYLAETLRLSHCKKKKKSEKSDRKKSDKKKKDKDDSKYKVAKT